MWRRRTEKEKKVERTYKTARVSKTYKERLIRFKLITIKPSNEALLNET